MHRAPRVESRQTFNDVKGLVLAVVQAGATRQTLALVNSEVDRVLEIQAPSVAVTVLHAGSEHFHVLSTLRGSGQIHIFHFFAVDLYDLCDRVTVISNAR